MREMCTYQTFPTANRCCTYVRQDIACDGRISSTRGRIHNFYSDRRNRYVLWPNGERDLHLIERQVCTWEAAEGGTSPSSQECLAKVSGILQWLFNVWFTEVIGELAGMGCWLQFCHGLLPVIIRGNLFCVRLRPKCLIYQMTDLHIQKYILSMEILRLVGGEDKARDCVMSTQAVAAYAAFLLPHYPSQNTHVSVMPRRARPSLGE